MKISVSVDDVGISLEDDEPFDEKRAATMIRVAGAELMNVYEASCAIDVADMDHP